jgi:hypothetical protein
VSRSGLSEDLLTHVSATGVHAKVWVRENIGKGLEGPVVLLDFQHTALGVSGASPAFLEIDWLFVGVFFLSEQTTRSSLSARKQTGQCPPAPLQAGDFCFALVQQTAEGYDFRFAFLETNERAQKRERLVFSSTLALIWPEGNSFLHHNIKKRQTSGLKERLEFPDWILSKPGPGLTRKYIILPSQTPQWS